MPIADQMASQKMHHWTLMDNLQDVQ